MKLYASHQSSAAYRVRIALAYKNLPYRPEFLALDPKTGGIDAPEYRLLNPLGSVPTLVDGQRVYRQALAIIEYLEEVYPDPALLPGDSRDRERIRALSHLIVRDIDARTDPQVMAYLRNELKLKSKHCEEWTKHWVDQGMQALERLMEDNPATARFCHGDLPTMADICLVSQVYFLIRSGWSLEPYPTIAKVYHECMELDAFRSTGAE